MSAARRIAAKGDIAFILLARSPCRNILSTDTISMVIYADAHNNMVYGI